MSPLDFKAFARAAVIRPGITTATLEANGIVGVTAAEAKTLCGHKAGGLWIPYRHLDGSPVERDESDRGGYGRLRLSVPDKGRKYLQRAGSKAHLFIPAGLGALLTKEAK